MTKEFLVFVKTTGDASWSSNMVSYPTVDMARDKAQSLMDRWFAVEEWAILPDDTVDSSIVPPILITTNAVERY